MYSVSGKHFMLKS